MTLPLCSTGMGRRNSVAMGWLLDFHVMIGWRSWCLPGKEPSTFSRQEEQANHTFRACVHGRTFFFFSCDEAAEPASAREQRSHSHQRERGTWCDASRRGCSEGLPAWHGVVVIGPLVVHIKKSLFLQRSNARSSLLLGGAQHQLLHTGHQT